jgi:protein-S-isoprenylcysteine O-methyltransferase Ste14
MPPDAVASNPSAVRRPGFAACVAAIRAPELYRNFAVHAFVMFPAAMAMCWLATRVDARLGWGPWLAEGPALTLGVAATALGGAWVWYVYGYLYLAGGGSPGTHVDGGPTTLVDTGPYAVVRHPSVLGKLLCVVGLGVAWRSPAFLVLFVPVLVAYSVVTNRYLQERFCDQRFGARYAAYRAVVPMLLPRPSGVLRWVRGDAALPDDAPPVPNVHPPGIAMEFVGYLVGLAGLLAFFAWLGGVP